MALSSTKVLVMTANLGTFFESNEIAKNWLQAFDQLIALSQPSVIALHCQEMGGKNFRQSMKAAADFGQQLLDLPTMKQYDRSRCFVDTDVSSQEEDDFTALGSFYYVHNSIEQAEVWDFKANTFVSVSGHENIAETLKADLTHRKEKFPLDFFPEVRWTRKGFMFCRWKLFGRVLSFVNIHLFHDEDNFISLNKAQSHYKQYRKHALEYTWERICTHCSDVEPLFIFGDFNFRLDCPEVVKPSNPAGFLVETDIPLIPWKMFDVLVHEVTNKDEKQLVYRNSISGVDSQPLLTVTRKSFILARDDTFRERFMELRKFDTESAHFRDILSELDISFQPSYPFSENVDEGEKYLTKRCPAWCDRILMNHPAFKLVDESPIEPEYCIMSKETCVGDHKPVYLLFDLQSCGPA